MTIISELSAVHQQHKRRSTVIVAKNTMTGYPYGEPVEVDIPGMPSKSQVAIDVLSGLIGVERPNICKAYERALDGIPHGFDGAIFCWNQPAILPMVKRRFPQAAVCLYAQNQLFKTYSRSEAVRVLSKADYFFACSKFIFDDIVQRSDERLRNRGCVVINGVNAERFRPILDKAVQPPLILFVGRMQEQKGPHLLIAAAKELLARGRQFKLRIIGSSGFCATDPLSPYERSLRQAATGLEETIEFRPFTDRDSIVDAYAEASIFCVPSIWQEPCALTLPEGMAMGIPTVAARRGGMPEAGGTGAQFFEPTDLSSLVEVLDSLLTDPAKRSEWGRKARERGEQLSWSNQYQVIAKKLSTPV